MSKYHPLYPILALAPCLFLLVNAQADLSTLSCPETCSTSRRTTERDCIKYGIIGCFPRRCTTDTGRRGYICTVPTPVPTACPSICRPNRRGVIRECRPFHFLRCSVMNCRIPDPDGGIDIGGYSCADPTPTPTACTDACRGTESEAARECRKLVLLGCSVQQCIIDIEGSPSKLGFACSTPTPTPTACPDVCMEFEVMSRRQCREVSGLGLGCRVQRCAGGRGFICATPLPSPSPSPAPVNCPSRCRLTNPEAAAECGGPFATLGCEVRPCRRLSAPDSMGFSCTFPTPTPVACPDMCAEPEAPTRRACERLPDSLGCEVQRCDRGFGRMLYTCATPTPTPTACPGVCYGSASLAVEECTTIRSELGLICTVETCVGPEGVGFSCGTPVIDPMFNISLDGPSPGDDFKFNLNLSVAEGAGVSREDFYLLTDATGSMAAEIATVRARFLDIVNARSAVSDDVQFGVGFYRDEVDGFDNGFNNLQAITDNMAAVETAINSLSAAAGGDTPEANLVALYRLATDVASIGWRMGSRRIIVMLGDVPGHEPTCIPGAPELTRTVVRDALIAEGITLVAVSFAPGMDGPTSVFGCPSGTAAAGTGQTTFIATATGGSLISSTSTALIEAIDDTVGSLSLSFDADTSDCDGLLTSTYDPPLPAEVDAGTSVTVCQVITLLPGVCDAGDSFECQIRYTASGADTGTLTVSTSNIVGCT